MLKKVLCALLASVMLVGTLAACGETTEENPKETTETTKAPSAESSGNNNTETGTGAGSVTGAAESEIIKEEETKLPLEVPADSAYKGKTVTFLTRDEAEWTTVEIYAKEISANTDNINNAVYERNKLIQEKYGITIKELKENTGEHSNKLTTEIASGNGDFLAIISNTSGSASYATQGYLRNLLGDSITHLDFSKPWWDSMMAEGMRINERLYFATGDLLTADNDATFVLLFNKKIASDNQLPDMYSLVNNKQWTMQKFYDFSKDSALDKKGDGELKYDEDIAGFAYTGDAPFCFLFGGGITICQKDENDTPYYNMNVERASNIADMGKKLFDKSHAINLNQFTDDANTIMKVGQTNFGENHSLFLGEVMQSVTRMRSYNVDFGILPFPMFDEEQGDYYSMMHITASVVSIPKHIRDEKLDLVCAAIETMAYYSVDTLTYQYYEINLKTRDSKDVQSGPMMDKILAGRLCDLSYYFGWRSAYNSLANTLLPTGTGNVSTLHKQWSARLDNDIEKAVNTMDKNAEKED